MTDVRNIIARGKTLTGRKLRQAIESATGTVVGGRGIKVVTVNRQSVVSLKGHPIIGGGGGAGVTLGVVSSFSADFNATYTIIPLPGAIGELPASEVLAFVTPQGRMFDTGSVDFHNAPLFSLARIHPLPLASGYTGSWYSASFPGDGACMVNNVCSQRTGSECGVGIFYGVGSPCAAVYISENVKISTCPIEPLADSLPPPPVISQIAGLLS